MIRPFFILHSSFFIAFRLLAVAFILCIGTFTQAQDNFNAVLKSIESNNTTLKAFQKQAEAQKTANKTGIYLPNPEVEFHYLWGNPEEVDNRVDLNVTQSFDFPTAYHYKSKLAEGQNKQVDWTYQQERKNVLLQARLLCVDLVYRNLLKTELNKRLKHATEMNRAYQTKFDKGDVDILELNKTRFNLLTMQKTVELNEVEITGLMAELTRLNGGIPISFELNAYSNYTLSSNFDQWYQTAEQNNPTLKMAEQDIETSRIQERLNRAMSLPKLSAGYMSERTTGTSLQGVSATISIPLWENKNTIKAAKAQTYALQSVQADNQMQFRNTLQSQYNKATSLQQLLASYKETLHVTNNQTLLDKALQNGQLSLINYLAEQTLYYDVTDKLLETERDFQYAVSELWVLEN